MAQIKTFTADISPNPIIPYGERMRAPNLGIEEVGRNISEAAHTLTNLLVDDDVRETHVRLQEIRANSERRMLDAKLSGEDTDKLRAQLDSELFDLQGRTTTRRGYDTVQLATPGLFAEFNSSEHALRAVRFGEQAKSQAQRSINAGAVALQANPGNLPAVLATHNEIIDSFAGRLSPEVLSALKDVGAAELSQHAAQSLIALNPEAALALLSQTTPPQGTPGPADANPDLAVQMLGSPAGGLPEQYRQAAEIVRTSLTPDNRTVLINQANQVIKARWMDEEHQHVIAERRQKAFDEQVHQNFLSDYFSGKADQWTNTKIATFSGLSGGARDHLLGLKHKFDEEKLKPGLMTQAQQAATANMLYMRLNIAEGVAGRIGDQKELDDELLQDRISREQHKELSRDLEHRDAPNEKRMNETITAAHRALSQRDPILGTLFFDPDQEYAFAGMITDFRQELQAATKAGKDPTYLFDAHNPHSIMARIGVMIRNRGMDVMSQRASELKQQSEAARAPAAPAALAPRAPAAAPAVAPLPTPKTRAEYNKLPSGAHYLGTDGKHRIKQ